MAGTTNVTRTSANGMHQAPYTSFQGGDGPVCDDLTRNASCKWLPGYSAHVKNYQL